MLMVVVGWGDKWRAVPAAHCSTVTGRAARSAVSTLRALRERGDVITASRSPSTPTRSGTVCCAGLLSGSTVVRLA